jgi:nitrite reductase/ring-hydroxylating ferredoxin subunit
MGKIMGKQKICNVNEFPSDGRYSMKIENNDIAIFKIDDNYYAINRKCTHMGGNLAKGKLDGKTVTCPLHGAKYDLESGDLIHQVGTVAGLLKKAKNAQTYKVWVENNEIWIDIP